MSCCGARNLLLAVRSQDFDRGHSLLLAVSAAGGARKRPRFGNPLDAIADGLYTKCAANASGWEKNCRGTVQTANNMVH